MGKVCRGPRSLVLSAVLCFVLAGGFGGVAAGIVIPVPDPPILQPSIEVSPRVLPKSHRGAAALHATVRVKDGDLNQPPRVLRELSFELDKGISIDIAGLPVCRRNQLLSLDTDAAKKRCGDAIVGAGRAAIRLDLYDASPLDVKSKLLIFNGGTRAGEKRLFLHAHITAPRPKAIVIPVGIEPVAQGPFGSVLTATIPEIVEGAGRVTALSMTIDRKYAYRDRKLSVVSARCRTGHLQAKVSARFQDREIWVWQLFQECAAGTRG